jgi:carbamoyl-phosphate synthase/aspartate carbamoyltransferase/dihydroorotase
MKALWENMNIIDCFATDHAPHTADEKCCKGCPGFPGLETALPLLLDAVYNNRLTLEDIILRYHTNPKRIFGLPDQPETFVEVDPDFEWIIPERPKFSKCDWTPFAGRRVRGAVKRVMLRGQIVYVADHPDANTTIAKVLCVPGYGQLVSRVQAEPIQQRETRHSLGTQLQVEHVRRSWSGQRHYTTVDVLTKDRLRELFHLADELVANKELARKSLIGKRLGLLFLEASTRTRVSFEAAMQNLGGDVIYISSTESSIQKGETLNDTLRCLAGTCDAVVVRQAAKLTATNDLRIINAGDGTNEHPTQTLVDLYTIRQEIGTLGEFLLLALAFF